MIDSRSNFCKRHYPRTEEHIRKQAETLKGKRHSEAARQKMSEARTLRAESLGNASFLTKCLDCGKEFRVKPSQAKNGEGQFCSSVCSYNTRTGEKSSNWKGGKAAAVCPQCEKTFFKTPAALKGHKNYFCSSSCRSIYNKSHQKTKGTDIEILMESTLSEMGVNYISQYPITRISVVDFYLPDSGVVIYCDGDYWHNLPKHKEKDILQNDLLATAGYRVLRFWGKEIKEEMPTCINKIKQAIAKGKITSDQLCLWG
jgi:very-short-patch-repair endonuclease